MGSVRCFPTDQATLQSLIEIAKYFSGHVLVANGLLEF